MALKDEHGWLLKDNDLFMDAVLDGKDPEEIACMFNRSVKEVGRHFHQVFYPSKPYHPWGRRKSRTGMKLTQLELKIIHKHNEAGIPVAHTARMLARKPIEINPDYYGRITFRQMKCLAPVADQLLAHHYLYYVSKSPIISDQAYDEAKEEEIEYGGGGPLLRAIAETDKQVCNYPPHIRSLANYMHYKFMEVTGEWNDRVLPYSWGVEKREGKYVK